MLGSLEGGHIQFASCLFSSDLDYLVFAKSWDCRIRKRERFSALVDWEFSK